MINSNLLTNKKTLRINKIGFGIQCLMLFIILFDYHFFYLVNYDVGIISLFLKFGNQLIIGMLACFMAVCVYLFHYKRIRVYGNYVPLYCLSVFLIFALFAFYTILTYPEQKIADTFRYGGKFLYPILAIGFLYLFERDKGPKKWLNILNKLVFLWYLYVIIQSFYYKVTGNLLFDFRSYFGEELNLREENLRVGPGSFGNIMLLYNLVQVLGCSDKKISLFSVLQVLLGAYCLFFVQQTRVAILIIVICAVFILLFRGKTTFQKVIKPLIVLVCGIFLVTNDTVWEFINSFSATGEQAGSTIARLYAWEYYFDQFLQNPLFGFAWPGDEAYFSIAHGAQGSAYISDVGFVGLIAELGIFAIPFYVAPLIRMVYILSKIGWKNALKEYMFLVVLLLYLLGTSITLLITTAKSGIGFPFIIALFEYEYAKMKKLNRGKV